MFSEAVKNKLSCAAFFFLPGLSYSLVTSRMPAITSPIVLSEAPAAIVGRSLRRRTSLEEKNSPMQPAIPRQKRAMPSCKSSIWALSLIAGMREVTRL